MIYVYAILLVLLVAYAFLIAYYHKAWKSLSNNANNNIANQPVTSITVLVPARNESANIRSCIESLLEQDYPASLREIIVIDDHSTDDTVAIVESYAGKGIRCIRLAEVLQGQQVNAYKKLAIATGITMSGGKLIVTTDADCTASRGWLREIAQLHELSGAQFIAAPVRLTGNNSFLGIFQQLDFISLQGITGASVFKGVHAMCNGANLAYTREAFQKVNGFEGINHIASGDDMLLMYKIAKAYPGKVRFLKSPGAIVSTPVQPDLRSFLRQRIRWASKARHYDDRNVLLVLILVYLLNIGLLSVIITAFFSTNALVMAIGLLLVKTLAELPFMITVAGFFSMERLMLWFPLMQPFHVLYTVLAGSFGQWGSYEWKGRKVS
ncbi:glycosyltransferase [Flavihumibacter rivuli]|uniref:glycosyltransferase n=1 Tax=Flavihumibacter rivuli TaxID=2838156 RepID=UPI001BDF42FE|nr:glycosyltransferase [Flavihumibacter rivuli]ULQ55517.1 glycosyltransferase [Flavihumibacter rivuli]